jgi:rSAM/selenodomain-associated transferase 1
VKTRLAKTIGDVPASEIYQNFLATILRRFENVCDLCTLSVSPVSDHHHFQHSLIGPWQLIDQGDGDLGQRMSNYFAQAFKAGADRVLLIGSDSPNLPVSYVTQAIQQLDHNDVVLGPTEDGGYYLIGMKRLITNVFENIAWSTEDVWQQTVDILVRNEVAFGQLSTWYDVDNETDLRKLQSQLAHESHDAHLISLHKAICKVPIT